jgi:hypothetical protein
VDASELRDQMLKRQRELAARHEALNRLDPQAQGAKPEGAGSQGAKPEGAGSSGAKPQGADPQRYGDQLARVFDATNDLIVVLDLIDARAVRRRMLVAVALVGLVFVLAVLVASGVLPAYWLVGALLALTAAVTVWLSTRDVAEAGRGTTA